MILKKAEWESPAGIFRPVFPQEQNRIKKLISLIKTAPLLQSVNSKPRMNMKCNKPNFNNVPVIIAPEDNFFNSQQSSEFVTAIVHLLQRNQFVNFVNRS